MAVTSKKGRDGSSFKPNPAPFYGLIKAILIFENSTCKVTLGLPLPYV